MQRLMFSVTANQQVKKLALISVGYRFDDCQIVCAFELLFSCEFLIYFFTTFTQSVPANQVPPTVPDTPWGTVDVCAMDYDTSCRVVAK